MSATDIERRTLDELLDELESVRVGPNWNLPVDYVLSLTETSREDYFRTLYQMEMDDNARPDFADEFNPENTETLVRFLRGCGYTSAESRLHRAGYFFTTDQLLHWLEFFQSVTLSRMQNHPIDREQLEIALAGCRHFEDGAQFYCECVFERDEFIHFAADLYLQRYQIARHHLSLEILEGFLLERIRLGWLRWEDLCRIYSEHLRARAREWGLPGVDEEEAESWLHGAITPEVARALRTLELPAHRMPEPAKLKKQYRALLKKYHPDVNPEGAERTRQLIVAFSIIAGKRAQAREHPA
ncbi:MAG: J domain-containing protein [Leptospiraceae bacterium]|nr:J domain-containing protein [Leptospiraceae bacterium]MCB1314514.1 J domain-containing protein [Leptospiraceae bacterium]